MLRMPHVHMHLGRLIFGASEHTYIELCLFLLCQSLKISRGLCGKAHPREEAGRCFGKKKSPKLKVRDDRYLSARLCEGT